MPNQGEVLASWHFKSHRDERHSIAWYVGMGALALVLLIYSVTTSNFLFGIIVILIAGILIANEYRPARDIKFAISTEGINLGEQLWKWHDLEAFWLAHNPPEVNRLYFTFKSHMRPRLPIPLEGQDPDAIKKILLEHLSEHERRRDREPMSDQLGRMLKM